jgi:hypothetical protein
VYKDGSATEKTTTNGITVTSPFDSLTGSHLIELDTSNSTGDVGFWASGSAYRVVISTAKTVDSKDPSGVCVGEFSIELQTADTRKIGGTTQTARDLGASVLLSNGTGTGQVKLSSGYISPNWGDVGNPTTTVALTGTTISTSQIAASVTGAVGSVTSGVTVTTNNDKTGYSLASGGLAAVTTWTVGITGNITGNVSGSVGSVGTGGITSGSFAAGAITASAIATDAIGSAELASTAITEIQSGLALSTDITTINATLATIAAYIDTEVAAIKAKTDALPTDPADQSLVEAAITAATTGLATAANVAAVVTTQMTESYAADGVAPTLAQAVFLIQQALTEFTISGTTTTIKKLDGTTTAATLTLNDETTPTGVTRAS